MDEQFRKKIINDFGLATMAIEDQDKMIEKIGNLLFESVVERSVDLMDEESMQDFESLLNEVNGEYQKIIDFMRQRIPGFNKVVSEEMDRLKKATTGIFAQ